VPDLDLEAVAGADGVGDTSGPQLPDLPARAALGAVEVAMLVAGQDVELLVAIGAMAVTDEAELLEDVEGAVHGRRDRRRITPAASVDQLRGRDVAVGLGENLDDRPPLWGPAQASLAQPLADAVPGRRKRRDITHGRSVCCLPLIAMRCNNQMETT